MLIAVVSDTHKMNKYIQAARKTILESRADVVIHLGDNSEDIESITEGFNGDVYGVRGNCDCIGTYPKERLLKLDGKSIFMCHGDAYGVKFGLNNIYFKGREVGADIILFGHTHEAIIEKEGKVILMNPGSVSLPRFRGRYIGLINIDDNGSINTELRNIEEE